MNLTEYLWDLSMDGGHDDETGDVEGPGWYALFDSVDMDDGDEPVYAILSVDGAGFKDVTTFDSHSELSAAWKDLQSDISRFYDGAENPL